MLTKQQSNSLSDLLQILLSALENKDIQLAKVYVRKITDFVRVHTEN